MTTQHAAADPARSAWVSANAGAGKTYTLANRVTRLLLDGAKPERILCLTYTKAAAAEMAGRLFDQLGHWAMAPDGELRQRVVDIGAKPLDAEGLRRARRLFALALETPGGLKIQTIHSFCQYLLARFPLEAGVPPGFRVLDDQTANELRDAARTRVLERAGAGEQALADAVAHIVTETSESQLGALIGSALGSNRRKLERFLETLEESDNALAAAIRRAHGAGPDDTVQRVCDAFMAEMRDEDARLRDVAACLAGGLKSDIDCGKKLLLALTRKEFAGFAEIFLTAGGAPRKRLATKNLAQQHAALFGYFDSVMVRFLAAEERRRAAHAAALAEAALVLITAARSEYEEAKRLRGVLDYDDLIVSTQRLLEKGDAAQWVLYKLDGGLDHILIDEAQDTSPEQWAIVTRLTEEFFAGEGISRAAPRTIFAVGDEKQSIFSFQGAEPREFDIHRRHFAARIAKASFVDMRLDISRRSVPDVLAFVDRVFASSEARRGVASDDAPIQHRAHRASEKGRVELWPLLCPGETPEPDHWRPVDVLSVESPATRLAERLALEIRRWTDGRTKLPGHAAAIRPGDIMVLMPRREPFASAIIRALKMHGVPVAGADRIRLVNQIAVMDLMALGRFVLLPEDDLNLAALLRSPLCGLTEDELFALCVGRDGPLWHALRKAGRHAGISEYLAALRARADFMPPYEFYQSVLSADGMRTPLLTRLGSEAADAIDEFLALALSYEALSVPSLEGFLHWVEHGDAEVKRDMERARDEVRVMTVHGAKGLEADIVILPDTASMPGGLNAHGDILYTDNGPVFPVRDEIAPQAVRLAKDEAKQRMQEEHRRLLYVALTRARDRLYICGFRGKKEPSDASWYALAEQAAQDIGVAVARGGETVNMLGDAEFEKVEAGERDAGASTGVAAWALEPAKDEQAQPRLIRPSEAAGEDPFTLSPAGAQNAARFRRGNLIHALLNHLPEIAPALRHEAAMRYLETQGTEPAEAQALAAETLRVVEEPAFAPVFSPASRAEVAIVADLPELGPGARISGRIDRLYVSERAVLALDFKTNRPPPKNAAETPKLYLTQMALYRAALAKIFPGRRIACALLWTDGPRLMHLADAVLDDALLRRP